MNCRLPMSMAICPVPDGIMSATMWGRISRLIWRVCDQPRRGPAAKRFAAFLRCETSLMALFDSAHFAGRESALEAARKSPFKRPREILDALTSLDEIAAGGASGDILRQLKERGWGKRSSMHISATTKKTYGKHYQFEYDGKIQYFEPHITLGSGAANSCASIHYLIDHERGKIVIGHVGRHLPNTKT